MASHAALKKLRKVKAFVDAEAYIPIAHQERRVMAMASREDIAAWQAIEKSEFDASRVSYEGKTEWRSRVLADWRADEKTLADVMARIDREKEEGNTA